MKTLILSLLIASTATMALANPVPTAVWDESTCSVIITPNGHALDGWFICVSHTGNIGLHHESENIECDLARVEIEDRRIVPLSHIIEDCSIATPNEVVSWSAMKSIYR